MHIDVCLIVAAFDRTRVQILIITNPYVHEQWQVHICWVSELGSARKPIITQQDR